MCAGHALPVLNPMLFAPPATVSPPSPHGFFAETPRAVAAPSGTPPHGCPTCPLQQFNLLLLLSGAKDDAQRRQVAWFGQGGALKQHRIHPLAQGAHAPSFDAAHLGIEVSGERVFQVDQLQKVAPSQLSRHHRDNLSAVAGPFAQQAILCECAVRCASTSESAQHSPLLLPPLSAIVR